MYGHKLRGEEPTGEIKEKRNGDITVGRVASVGSPNLDESILNIVADRPISSTRAVAHHLVKALNPADYLLQLPVGGTAKGATAALHSSRTDLL
ncbi:hypothetical protein TNCV_4534531 [Trichonephila clavipes]|nr:hypothetical protein TNCV_4534531 [Trichonephila clavipes]